MTESPKGGFDEIMITEYFNKETGEQRTSVSLEEYANLKFDLENTQLSERFFQAQLDELQSENAKLKADLSLEVKSVISWQRDCEKLKAELEGAIDIISDIVGMELKTYGEISSRTGIGSAVFNANLWLAERKKK